MAGEMGSEADLKQTILESLYGSLSYDQNERAKAEDQLKMLETTEGNLNKDKC